MGGHSLLASQLISRVREAFSVELPLRSLFEAPTVRGQAELVGQAIEAGRLLQVPPIVPVARDGTLPLSFAQQRLWFMNQLEEGSALFNISQAVRLNGYLHRGALEQSLTEIIRRHEVLRTTFTETDQQLTQYIAAPAPCPVPLIDLSDLPEVLREETVRRLAHEEARLSFDLSRGPLVRARLLHLKTDEHVLLLSMHHIVSDNWSAGLLVRELVGLYKAFAGGQPSPLPELPIQYADFAIWQRQWLCGEVLQRQVDYWKQQLANAPSALKLITDRPRPTIVTSRRGGLHSTMVSPQTTAALKALSRHAGVTLFMTLLAAFKTLLYLYSGQEDIVVGTPIANRTRVEIESLIGFFVNTLVLRTQFSGEENFQQLLRRVREVCLGAYAHQDLPFERLVEELQPQRDGGAMPFFQVMFGMPNAPTGDEPVQPAGLKMSGLERGDVVVAYDLILFMGESNGGLVAYLGYNSDLYEEATIRRLSGDLIKILDDIGSNAERPLMDIELGESKSPGPKREMEFLRLIEVEQFDF